MKYKFSLMYSSNEKELARNEYIYINNLNQIVKKIKRKGKKIKQNNNFKKYKFKEGDILCYCDNGKNNKSIFDIILISDRESDLFKLTDKFNLPFDEVRMKCSIK